VRLLAAADVLWERRRWNIGGRDGCPWGVEVRSVILKRLVGLRDMKPIAPFALVAHLIASNHLRGE